MNKIKFRKSILENLNDIYAYNLSSKEIKVLAEKIITLNGERKKLKRKSLSQSDILLITYANTIVEKKKKIFFSVGKVFKKIC